MKKLLLLTALVCSCGNNSDWFHESRLTSSRSTYSLPNRNIDPLTLSTIEDFKLEAANRGIELSLLDKLYIVEFNNIEGDRAIVGICRTYIDTNGTLVYSRITIRPDFKDKIETYLFKALVFHELGHCILEKDHEPDDPKVIMSPHMGSGAYYELNWTELLDEFFIGNAAS